MFSYSTKKCKEYVFLGRGVKYEYHHQFLGKILRTSVQGTEEIQWLLGN